MKKLLMFVLVAGSAVWVAQEYKVLPHQDRLEAGLEEFLPLDSRPYAAFQDFATAMMRGDMDEVGELTAKESIEEQASKTYLALRQVVRDVHRVTYRLDAEDPARDDAHVTLSVSHAMIIDAVGMLSSFGTLTCEGKYAATMAETATGWKVSSFTLESSNTRPEEPRMVMGHPDSDAEWPCADSAWTNFADSWKEKVLGWTTGGDPD